MGITSFALKPKAINCCPADTTPGTSKGVSAANFCKSRSICVPSSALFNMVWKAISYCRICAAALMEAAPAPSKPLTISFAKAPVARLPSPCTAFPSFSDMAETFDSASPSDLTCFFAPSADDAIFFMPESSIFPACFDTLAASFATLFSAADTVASFPSAFLVSATISTFISFFGISPPPPVPVQNC